MGIIVVEMVIMTLEQVEKELVDHASLIEKLTQNMKRLNKLKDELDTRPKSKFDPQVLEYANEISEELGINDWVVIGDMEYMVEETSDEYGKFYKGYKKKIGGKKDFLHSSNPYANRACAVRWVSYEALR